MAPPVSYLWDCPRSRDQPSRGPAVALVPPLLNSVSDMSSGLKVVDWLLLSLKEESTFTFGSGKGMSLLPLQPTQARSPLGLVAPFLSAPNLILLSLPNTTQAPALGILHHRTTHWQGKKEKGFTANPCPNPSSGEWASLLFYLPNSFLIPLAFFLESGDGGVICRPSASFGRGGRPARSKWSADPFSVSAVRKQKLCQDPLVQDCTDMLLSLGMTPAKLLTATMPRKWGKEGWENP